MLVLGLVLVIALVLQDILVLVSPDAIEEVLPMPGV